MCRVLAYSGPPVPIEDLLFKPDSSLVRQAYAPRQLEMLNLGGFGMLAWDDQSPDPEVPWDYRSTELPVFDGNLRRLSRKARASCLLAHVRGIPYSDDAGFGSHNLHPFQYPGCRWAMAHNGDLHGIDSLRPELLSAMAPGVVARIRGTTDSELIYATLVSRLGVRAAEADADELQQALVETLAAIAALRVDHGIDRSSAVNLFFSDGESIVALRYTYDFGCYDTACADGIQESNLRYLGLWYTTGERYQAVDGEYRTVGDAGRCEAFLLASEPLTRDVTGWVEVPEHSILRVTGRGAGRRVEIVGIAG